MKKLTWFIAVCLITALLLGSVPAAFAGTYGTWVPILPKTGTTHVPEPATLTMLVVGLAGVGALRRKKAA